MQTVAQTPDTAEDHPHVTPLFVALLELAAAWHRLPPEPWPLP